MRILPILLLSALALTSCASDDRPRGNGLTPAGKFELIHSIQVSQGDGTVNDVQAGLRRDTCFSPGDAAADAFLRVDVALVPPPGRESYSLADADMLYHAVLRDRKGTVLWKGAQGTRVPVVVAPGVQLARGTRLYKEISPSDAVHLLLLQLRSAGCSQVKG